MKMLTRQYCLQLGSKLVVCVHRKKRDAVGCIGLQQKSATMGKPETLVFRNIRERVSPNSGAGK